jgi:Tfp pilus assembly protein PilW
MANGARKLRRRRGTTLVELVIAFLILAFVSIGTMQLYRVGDQQQRTARLYSDAQTRAREAMRRMLKTVRHGSAIEMGATNFVGQTAASSSTSQLVVTVPPTSSPGHIRLYLSGTSVYAQRSDDTGAGLEIATGVQSLGFTYYLTSATSSGTTVTQVNGAPASATEVEISLTMLLRSGSSATMNEKAYVSLRNKNLGL